MATIKLTGGRVVIKGGKASCSCCYCCLYPWPDPNGDFGGPFYPDTDLLASVVVSGLSIEAANGTYTLDGNTLKGPTVEIEGINYEMQIAYDGRGSGGIPTEWVIYGYDSVTDSYTAALAAAGCLIGNYSPSPVAVEDLFSDTYEVTDGETTNTVTRSAPGSCTWNGVDFTLRYNAATFKWVVSGPTSGAKNAPQNQPDGSFTNGITVS
jgi:hypothetical protein